VAAQLVERELLARGLAVRPVGGHRLERIGDEDDPGLEWDRVAGQAVGIAAAVEALVVVADPCRLERDVRRLDDVAPQQRMALHHLVLGVGEPAGRARSPATLARTAQRSLTNSRLLMAP
jgi:hypothetical protein